MGHGFATLPFAQHPSQEASRSQGMSHLQEVHHLQETSHSHSQGASRSWEMSTEESEDQESEPLLVRLIGNPCEIQPCRFGL